uniref:Uncharacterized protein n=1 Tax=Physcomitrium patens TaxID=3218 RepID=A0A2K1IVA6_PHYPA|nr:hypothetical protein PHYPA_025157 [Physcomitrium patens]
MSSAIACEKWTIDRLSTHALLFGIGRREPRQASSVVFTSRTISNFNGEGIFKQQLAPSIEIAANCFRNSSVLGLGSQSMKTSNLEGIPCRWAYKTVFQF